MYGDQSDTVDAPAHDLVARVSQIGRDVARPAARAVDEGARFPAETLAALRAAGALGAAVPAELGGAGLGIAELSAMCTALARHCASSAMILAMHHIQVSCIARHRGGSPELDDYLRSLATEPRLIASVTSEVGPGGDLRQSVAAVEGENGRFTLKKQATTVSYGVEADDLLVTARRQAGASSRDQVLVLLLDGEYALAPTGAWDALGMRGTCSVPATIDGSGARWQVLPDAFGDVAARTMVPVSHVLWASCWLGLASDAVAIARARLRAKARGDAGNVPLEARLLAETGAKLQLFRSEVAGAVGDCARLLVGAVREEPSDLGVALRMNDLKLSASRLVAEIVGEALGICGMDGYRNDTPYSLGRHLRDAHSAALMINNQRLLDTNASLWMVGRRDP